jgi:hypothetical protein
MSPRPFLSAARVLALAATAALIFGPATAEAKRHHRYAPPPPVAYTVIPEEPVHICQRWCDRDMSPCDPPYFKVADGRCASISPWR